MATSANRASPNLDIDLDLQDRIASAVLMSRSFDACHQEVLQASAAVGAPALVDENTTSTTVKRDISSGAISAAYHLTGSDSQEHSSITSSPSSSRRKSQTPRPSNQETARSLPGSPYSMTDSFASSPAGLPSSPLSSYSSIRMTPYSTSSFLRPGSRFEGTQTSDKQTYTVSVEIKYVDMRDSFLCGYLCIQGLTQDNPTLTTYFEGEMIGNKYAFKTKNKSWGANEKIDLQHWARFPAYHPFTKGPKNKDYHSKDFDQKEHIFMRWKEYFLVPNHRVKELTGASFDGFYYICFSQITGNVSGIYFHSNSEKWQQLELKHVPDSGVFGSVEFR